MQTNFIDAHFYSIFQTRARLFVHFTRKLPPTLRRRHGSKEQINHFTPSIYPVLSPPLERQIAADNEREGGTAR